MFWIGDAKNADRRNAVDACFRFSGDYVRAEEDFHFMHLIVVQVLLKQRVFSSSSQLFNPRAHLAEAGALRA